MVKTSKRSVGAPLFVEKKCLETVKRRDLVISPVSRHFLYSKVFRNSKTTKFLEIMTFSRDFVVFLFLDTFRIQGILLFLLFLDTFALTSENMTVRGHKRL